MGVLYISCRTVEPDISGEAFDCKNEIYFYITAT